MGISLLHTPEGVRHIYGKEYAAKQAVSGRIMEVFATYGFCPIQTPSFEFFDIFSKEKGSVNSREMFKFFDREGNTLVLRPDITPSIARCAAKYYMDEEFPLRLCYRGNTFVNNESLRGSLKEMTVLGAELINDTTSDADAEMVAMLVESLKTSGLKEFQVEVGLVDYFYGLIQDAGIDADTEAKLRALLEQKNNYGIRTLLESRSMDVSTREALLLMPRLFGGIEQIRRARELTKNEKALSALDRLEKLYGILALYGMEQYLTFDLGMLGRFRYYTGVVFQAYTYGTGTPVAAGGRYDGLLSQYGKDAPATGIAIYLDELMTALQRQKIGITVKKEPALLLYDRRQKEKAIRLAAAMRRSGKALNLMKMFRERSLEDYLAFAQRQGMDTLLYLDETGRTVAEIPLAGGAGRSTGYEEFCSRLAESSGEGEED